LPALSSFFDRVTDLDGGTDGLLFLSFSNVRRHAREPPLPSTSLFPPEFSSNMKEKTNMSPLLPPPQTLDANTLTLLSAIGKSAKSIVNGGFPLFFSVSGTIV